MRASPEHPWVRAYVVGVMVVMVMYWISMFFPDWAR